MDKGLSCVLNRKADYNEKCGYGVALLPNVGEHINMAFV